MSIAKNTPKEGQGINHPSGPKAKELKTEGPLSEKDEVKKAEERTNKVAKK